MTDLIFKMTSLAYAGPGEGHAHGPMGETGTQILGIIVIAAISGFVFWAMNRKK